MSDVLNAFVAQTYDPHGGIDAYEEKCAEVIATAEETLHGWIKESTEDMSRSQEITDYMEILSNLKRGELDEQTQSHPQLEGYDHSLEMDRLAQLRGKYDYVAPEHDPLDMSEMKMSTEAYENIDPSEVPSMSGLFDDVFGLGEV